MHRQILFSKIHRATVTDACIDYEGSITVDENLMDAANMVEGEKVLIANLTNGARIESYVIKGPRGAGDICLNGGAAKHGQKGDLVIIMTFAILTEEELKSHKPAVILVNERNEIVPSASTAIL